MLQLAFYYFVWHYTRGIKNYLQIWSNFLWFFWNLFSIGILLRSFLSPLRRIHDTYSGGLHPEEFFSSILVNLLMRLIGAFVRSILITLGFLALLISLVLGIVFLAVWLVAPFFVAVLCVTGLLLIFE